MAVVIQGLTHVYMPGTPYETKALDDINLTIETGEIFGLIGHTGSGKSTLIQHMNGLLKPTSGSVTVEDLDVTKKGVDRKLLVSTVGLVFQYPEYQLFEETVIKDIAFGPNNLGWDEQKVRESVEKACYLVGLDLERLGENSPFELSGGEKRRVALAGVLAMQPKVLIMDEPMAGLDPRGRKDIINIIRQIHADQDCTIIIVSHSMDDMVELAERIGVMQNGRLAMVGLPREVFADGERLEAMGMELPQSVKLATMLRQRGVRLPDDLLKLEDLQAYLIQRLGGAR